MQVSVLLLLGITFSVALASQRMPRFEYSSSSKIMLTWDDKWEVGGSNMLAILSVGKKIVIRVKVVGDSGSGFKRLLKYQCPQASADETIDLGSLTADSGTDRCPDTIPFRISAASGESIDEFLLIMGSTKLNYDQVFNQRIKITVEAEYSAGSLKSNALYVWSLDAISKFTSGSSKSDSDRRFLTEKAVAFMKRMGTETKEFNSLPFLEPAICNALKEAPDFFKAKINLGSILYFDPGLCSNFQMGKSVMFVNYNSKLDDENQKFQKLMRLNIEDGNLYYSSCGLRREIKRFYDEKKPLSKIAICTTASFSGEVEPYQRTDGVQQQVETSHISYTDCPTTSKACELMGPTNPSVKILSGMDYTAIVCPIICNDKTAVYRFFKEDRQLIGSQTEDWSFVEGIRISKTGNIVEFPPILSSTHSGKYRCEAGDKSFIFDVQVISLPQFQTDNYVSSVRVQLLGMPPPKVYAIEGEFISYWCEVYFAGLDTVRVSPFFYFPTTTGDKTSWERLSLDAFIVKVGADTTSFYINETAEGKDSKKLTVTIAKVPPVHPSFSTNFTHRFVCDASIDSSESIKVGMPTYGVESGGDVVFFPRLTRSHFKTYPENDCSVQICAFGKGAFFEYSLTDEFMNYLNSIEVEVESYFRLNDDQLKEVKVLFRGNASELNIENSPQRLAYRINPVTDTEVAKELVKRTLLTPVYNFKYKTNSYVTNLKLRKEVHGKPNVALGNLDCRVDRLCFYSTDFDVGSSLSFLPAHLTFTMPSEPAVVTANAMIIGIVIAIICLIIGIILIVYFLKYQPERAYYVEKKDIEMGNNPKEEARAEQFKEYQRVAAEGGADGEDAPRQGDRLSLDSISVGSGDDKELDQYKDDIDFKEFGEQGSFIGGYQNDPRKKEAFDAAQDNEDTV